MRFKSHKVSKRASSTISSGKGIDMKKIFFKAIILHFKEK